MGGKTACTVQVGGGPRWTGYCLGGSVYATERGLNLARDGQPYSQCALVSHWLSLAHLP